MPLPPLTSHPYTTQRTPPTHNHPSISKQPQSQKPPPRRTGRQEVAQPTISDIPAVKEEKVSKTRAILLLLLLEREREQEYRIGHTHTSYVKTTFSNKNMTSPDVNTRSLRVARATSSSSSTTTTRTIISNTRIWMLEELLAWAELQEAHKREHK